MGVGIQMGLGQGHQGFAHAGRAAVPGALGFLADLRVSQQHRRVAGRLQLLGGGHSGSQHAPEHQSQKGHKQPDHDQNGVGQRAQRSHGFVAFDKGRFQHFYIGDVRSQGRGDLAFFLAQAFEPGQQAVALAAEVEPFPLGGGQFKDLLLGAAQATAGVRHIVFGPHYQRIEGGVDLVLDPRMHAAVAQQSRVLWPGVNAHLGCFTLECGGLVNEVHQPVLGQVGHGRGKHGVQRCARKGLAAHKLQVFELGELFVQGLLQASRFAVDLGGVGVQVQPPFALFEGGDGGLYPKQLGPGGVDAELQKVVGVLGQLTLAYPVGPGVAFHHAVDQGNVLVALIGGDGQGDDRSAFVQGLHAQLLHVASHLHRRVGKAHGFHRFGAGGVQRGDGKAAPRVVDPFARGHGLVQVKLHAVLAVVVKHRVVKDEHILRLGGHVVAPVFQGFNPEGLVDQLRVCAVEFNAVRQSLDGFASAAVVLHVVPQVVHGLQQHRTAVDLADVGVDVGQSAVQPQAVQPVLRAVIGEVELAVDLQARVDVVLRGDRTYGIPRQHTAAHHTEGKEVPVFQAQAQERHRIEPGRRAEIRAAKLHPHAGAVTRCVPRRSPAPRRLRFRL